MSTAPRIRPIQADHLKELQLVAQRMRLTLVEVLGEERGETMYSLDWLEARARWHLNKEECEGEIYLSEDATGAITGHCIVRVEDSDGERFGLFSTTYVDPAQRRGHVASALIRQGEEWMREKELRRAVTYTDRNNVKLIGLFKKFGYTLSPQSNNMVSLEKGLCD